MSSNPDAMTLAQKQRLFVRLLPELITFAYASGYEISLGEAWRSPEEAKRLAALGKGVTRSLHCDRLAIDLNLFKQGNWLQTSEAHRPLGEHWEALSPLCCWGGRFDRADGNHYSVTHEGRK